MVRGICLDCGSTAPKPVKEPLPRPAVYENNAKSLTDIAAPELFSLTGEEISAAPLRVTAAKSFANPYSGVIPFESPDFGFNYAVPQAVIREFGTPKGIRVSDDGEEPVTRKMRISGGRRITDYWWILMLSLVLPWQISWLPVPALYRFDEKGGRTSGKIILAMTVIKLIIRKLIL